MEMTPTTAAKARGARERAGCQRGEERRGGRSSAHPRRRLQAGRAQREVAGWGGAGSVSRAAGGGALRAARGRLCRLYAGGASFAVQGRRNSGAASGPSGGCRGALGAAAARCWRAHLCLRPRAGGGILPRPSATGSRARGRSPARGASGGAGRGGARHDAVCSRRGAGRCRDGP